MKKLIFKIIAFLSRITKKWKLRNNQVVQDLIMNNHDFCINCGEIYYVSTATKKFCSNACRSRFNYILKKK